MATKEIEVNIKSAAALFVIAALVVSAVVFFGTMLVTVGAGQVGVVFDPFGGGVKDSELPPGTHIKMPWQGIEIYNVKLQDYTMSVLPDEGTWAGDDKITCVTNEGLSIDLDITVWYQWVPGEASDIRNEIGTEFNAREIMLRPAIRSAIREVVSKHSAFEVYGDGRETVVLEMLEVMAKETSGKHVIIGEVLLRNVGLPPELMAAIEAKKRAEQEAQQMVYVLEKENLEAQRKIIEAFGVAEANRIVSASLTDRYIRWFWTNNLDKYDSIIYIPIGEDGLPIFKNIDEPTSDNLGP